MNPVPEYPKWRPLECEDKDLLDRFCLRYAPYAEATLATLLVWNDVGGCQIAELNGNLVLRHHSCGGGYVHSMLSTAKTIETARILTDGEEDSLHLTPGYSLGGLGCTTWGEASFRLVPDRDNDDYVFSTRRLAALEGSELKGKRKRRDGFARKFLPEVCTLNLRSSVDISDILRCAENWLRQAATYQEQPPDEEISGLNYLLELTARGDLRGMLAFGVRVEGELVGFSIVETHGTDTVSGVVFKASRECSGAGEYLRSTSAAQLARLGFDHINVQQDLGLPGLRQMKTAYRPALMLQKWTIKRTESLVQC